MTASSSRRGYAVRLLEWITALTLGSALTWWISAHQSVPASTAQPAERHCTSSSPDASKSAAITRVVERSTTAACDAVKGDFATARVTAQVEARQKSRDVMGMIEARAVDVERTSPDTSPEGIANRMSDYLTGLADALEEATPEMAEAMSRDIEQKVCGGETKPSDTRLMLQMRLLKRLPAFATTKAFDCFFDGHKEEDAVLWEGMDALASADMARPEALEKLRVTAVKSQTRTRFMSQEEYAVYIERERAAAVGKRAPSGDDPLALQSAE